MVYYYTSRNIKMLRNIIKDYEAVNEISPHEYMKTYIYKCPDTIEDSKVSWITETFLGIQKHGQFLKEIINHLSVEHEEDQDYFVIILHAVTFQIIPKDMEFLYKCLFNLSKPLLNTFTKFLSNNEVLSFISEIAQTYYDTSYTTEKIINPLFVWQPYISEMAHSYAEYVSKMEHLKLKPPTVPMQQNVLNRKGKVSSSISMHASVPVTPPNSLGLKKRMLTKSEIDLRLKLDHDKNKQKATDLLHDVQNKTCHYAKVKSERYYEKILKPNDQFKSDPIKTFIPKTTFTLKASIPPVKDTTANLKRINKRIQKAQEEEVQWLQTLITTCRNTTKIDEFEEHNRQEMERERLLKIEKKHLMGQISHEEAVIAKKKLQEDNKKKYEEFLKEKETWIQQIEKWQKLELEKNRKNVEKLSLIELGLLEAKNVVTAKKKETAKKIKKESEIILAKSMQLKQEELDRKASMIREIKILAIIAKKAKLPKMIDLTETSGVGLLCEMSLAELQERLVALKIGLNDELQRKRQTIKDENTASKQELEQTKNAIKNYMAERTAMRKQNKNSKITFGSPSSKEISDLKKVLKEKRKLRMNLTG